MPREMPDSTVLERQRRTHISEGALKDFRAITLFSANVGYNLHAIDGK